MSNKELSAIWEEISLIAQADLEYIKSLPDSKKLNDRYIQNYDRFLSDHFTKLEV